MVKFRIYTIISLILIVSAGLVVHLHETKAVELERPLSELPTAEGDWYMLEEYSFTSQILDVLKPTDYLARSYVGPQRRAVELYIGFHNGGPESGEIHSPKHCLPGGGWHELSSSPVSYELQDGTKLQMIKALYAKDRQKVRIYYWFQVMDKDIISEYALKIQQILNQLTHGRKDAAFIRISASEQEDEDEEMLRSFLNAFYRPVMNLLPR